MTTSDSISTSQFGFLPVTNDSGFRRPDFKLKMFDLSTDLHTNQPSMSPSMVSHYRRNGFSVENRLAPVEIVKHHGEHIVTNGHHRIAAARQLGKKRMKVLYGESDPEA